MLKEEIYSGKMSEQARCQNKYKSLPYTAEQKPTGDAI